MTTEYLQTEKILLRPYKEDDLHLLHVWFNDPEVTYFMFTGQKPTTIDQVGEIMKKDVNANNVIMVAVDKETSDVFGLVGLYEIHDTAKKAEMRIIIGNKDYWGKGYGTELSELINYYGFDRLNLHRIFLGFTASNQAAKRAYEKAGYIEEGVLCDDIYRNSQYYDSIRMAILRDDYYEKYYEDHKKRFSIKK